MSKPASFPSPGESERTRLLSVIDQFPAAAAVLEGPDHVYVAASEAYRRIVRGRELVGRPLREVLPELAEQGFVALLDQAYREGRPISRADVQADWDDDGDGRVETHFVDFVYQPLTDARGAVWGVLAYVVDVTERHRVESSLRESESRFRTVFDHAAIGIALVGVDGRPLAVNEALARMLGYSRPELEALTVAGITHPDDRATDSDLFRSLVAGERDSYRVEKRYFHRDGRIVTGELTVSLVRDDSGAPRFVVGLVEDITEWKRLDAERALLANVSRILGSSLDYETTLRQAARSAVPAVADWCAIDLLVRGELRRVAVEHPDPARVALAWKLQERYPPDPDAAHGVWAVIRTGEPELLAELPDELLVAAARDETHLRWLRELGIHSAVVVPLIARGETLGAITLVQAESGRRFVARDLALAEDLAARAATAIDNARLYAETAEARTHAEQQAVELEAQTEELQNKGVELEEIQAELEAANDELQRANADLEARIEAEEAARRRTAFLAEASRLLAGSLEYEATLENLARAAVPEMGDWCAVDMLVDPAATGWPPEVRRLAVVHQDPARVEWAREMEARHPTDWDAPWGLPRVLRDGKPEFYPVLTDEMLRASARSEEDLAHLREIGFCSYLCVPLLTRGRVLGALTLCMTESGRRYDEGDLEVVEDLARRAAVAVDSARLFAAEQEARRDAERAAERVARLQRVSVALSDAMTPERVAEIAVREGATALGAAAGVLALVREGEELEVVRSIGLSEEILERFRRFPLRAPLPLSDAVRERRPVYLGSDAERKRAYPQLAAEFPAPQHAAWASVPLEAEGRPLGALSLSFDAPQAFSGEDRAFIESLAWQCAQVLDRVRLFEAERTAREEAEAANRTKSDFLAVMSHELRTPLNAILGYLDLLQSEVAGPVSETQRRYLQRVTINGRHLLELIEEVLTFSRIEAQREEVLLRSIPLEEVVREASSIVEPLAEAKGLEFRVELDGPPLEWRTDPGKVRQILVNLLGNAVKFTERGTVIVSAHPFPREGLVRFEIRDTGIGIPPEMQEKIFEPFWQVDQGSTRAVGGTGLGLTVSRELARLLGGDISVKSEPGEGTTFFVRLPGALQPAG